ncbi:uncharacterized protein LOC111699007 [Eurytemora carolleeae]|uniref:uncharacterized protein LOC111699007 n=1 Tax=Eurytemora carolleeae TaxID=1294199 RepID=UPI000C787F51|nr:uncharacterized protein LOC111699007 [Eurytemora carolleeae]|eukprot:XP_023325296.1 uncharacterized protein LOC111699007 [Eurytemora affinis]
MLQQLLPASLGRGGGSDPLGHLLPSTDCDWEQELLSVANCPTKLGTISTALDHGPSTLNTPIIEINQDIMFSNAPKKETIMAELSVDLAPPSSGIFDDLWTIPGTPEAQELLHAPLTHVEGKSEPNTEFTEHSTISNSYDYVIESDDDNSMIVEAKEEVPDVLQWIVDDTINQNSEIPGEEFHTPATVVLEPPYSEYLPSTSVGTDPVSPVLKPTPFSRLETVRAPGASMSTRGGEGGGPVRQKRGRGRPPVPMGRQITPKVAKPRITSGDESDHVYSATEGNLTDAEVSDMRYRRMRDLNNEASKRCRENRKLKNELLEAEFEIQRDRNVELRARLTRLENRVRQIKTLYLQHIASGQNADLPDITQPWTPKDF